MGMVDQDIPMGYTTSSHPSDEKDTKNEHPELVFIPWAVDQPETTDKDSISTQEKDEEVKEPGDLSSSTSLAPFPPDEPLQIDPVNLMSLSQTFHILPTPEDGDDLETTVNKVSSLAEVVQQGNSLALWTGMKLAPETAQDAESIAKTQMTVDERRSYEVWKEWAASRNNDPTATTTTAADTTTTVGNASISSPSNEGTRTSQTRFRLPAFNWEANIAPVPQGAQSSKKFAQRAAAMDIVFGHQGATPENAAWLTYNLVPILPLVKAVTKISNMERHFRENKNKNTSSVQGLSGVEAAEMETARRIVAAAERNMNRELERLRRMTRELNRSNTIIKARMRELEGKNSKDAGLGKDI
ncbi:hypothetical protein BJY01DRAFT_214785 [Aspergillus pseudoustus]|uniref:Uncharacterized protein n=1 Tax=Aspergillus pseudoustus TaxID=1810923 RepID=A0ABR4JXI4_9EURO